MLQGSVSEPGMGGHPTRFVMLLISIRSNYDHCLAEMFSTLCTVVADTSKVAKTLPAKRGVNGARYYRQDFKVILLFGLTELKAQISWVEDVSQIAVTDKVGP